MEFLGDAVLGYVVCTYIYEQFPDLLEGDLTKIKSAVVSRRACARVAKELDLVAVMNMGKGMTGRPQVPASVWAASLEAVIAAIYLDGGIEPATKFILEHMKPMIGETAECAHQENFKSLLQHHAQKHLPTNPVYVLLDEKGPDHAKCFEVCAEIDGTRYPSAWAQSKKQAEQDAALRALEELGVVYVSDDGVVSMSLDAVIDDDE